MGQGVKRTQRDYSLTFKLALSRPEYGLHLLPQIDGDPDGTRCETNAARLLADF
jgi:hypothetical protein